MVTDSLTELANLVFNAVKSAGKRHVHKLGLSVHLKATKDGLINLVVNSELLAGVLGVGLEGGDNLRLLVGVELRGRDDGDLLLLVELLVELGVLVGDAVEAVETLVLVQHLNESLGGSADTSNFLKDHVELSNLLRSDALVLSEESEHFAVLVDLLEVAHILEDVVEVAVHGGSGEEYAGVTAINGVFLGGRLVVSS